MKIKEMCEKERPREKLLRRGAETLSDGELLAIFVQSGTEGRSAIDVAQHLLCESGGSLAAMAGMGRKRLTSVSGIGDGRAAALMAAFELGRRYMAEEFRFEKESFVSARQVYTHILPSLKGLTHEECWALFLNRHNYLICSERMSTGALDATLIDVRSIVRRALDHQASSVILVHNHPSGCPVPGGADKRETERLREALNTCGLSLADHVVVSDDSYFSFADGHVSEA